MIDDDDDDGDSSSSSNSSADDVPAPVDAAVVQDGEVGGWPTIIEGNPVEVQGDVPNQRLVIRCPHHANCCRGIPIGTTQSFHPLEVHAFLALWARAGDGMNKAGHDRCRSFPRDQLHDYIHAHLL